MSDTSKRFLIVGSFLRPRYLLDYKNQIEHREDIAYPFYDAFDGYREAESRAVKEVVKKQLDTKLAEITDGEFTKSLWHLDFLWGWNNVRRFINPHGYLFRDEDGSTFETRRDVGIEFTGPIGYRHHAFIDHFQHLQSLTPQDQEIKQCIVAPSHVFCRYGPDADKGAYASAAQLKDDLAMVYKAFLDEYHAVGGRIIQFDDCSWSNFASDNKNSPFAGQDINSPEVQRFAHDAIALNNEVIDYAHKLGIKVYTHNCRGNYASRNFSDGSYEAVADLFLKQQNYDRFYLEWDDERAGDLSALKAFADKPDTEVVLGFLSSKTGTLDDEERALTLLQEATRYVAKDKLYLSHQCGFASCDCGNELSEAQQWEKVKQGQRIAYRFWGE